MLVQVYNDDYIVKQRDIENGGFQEAPLHFILCMQAMTPDHQLVMQMVPMVEWEGKLIAWQDGIIHVKPRKKVNA